MQSATPEPAPTYLQLRKRILSLKPQDIDLVPSAAIPQVWGVLMETGYEMGTATLVALADGTTSLYYSTGGGMLGSADYLPVADASKAMVFQAEHHLKHMTSAEEIDLPSPGQVRFSLLTFSGIFTAKASEASLSSGANDLSMLYQSGRETLRQLSLLKDKKRND